MITRTSHNLSFFTALTGQIAALAKSLANITPRRLDLEMRAQFTKLGLQEASKKGDPRNSLELT